MQLQNLDELIEIKQEITPMMKGQATKQRLQLIVSYINAASNTKKEADQQKTLDKLIELFRPMVIELISSIVIDSRRPIERQTERQNEHQSNKPRKVFIGMLGAS